MAMPATGYPTTLDDYSTSPSTTVEFPQPSSSTDLDATNVEHDILHSNLSKTVVELQTKLGIGASPAASAANDTFLKHTGSGTTEWAAAASTSVIEVQVFS